MSQSPPLRQRLDRLAQVIADKAASGDASLQECIDALKVLTPFYALLQRIKRQGDDDAPGDELSFESFSQSISSAEKGNGRKAVSNRQ